jgi:integrase
MTGKKLTKRTVDAMTPAARDAFLWDSELPGFGCKITPTGLRVYVFQYTKGRRKPRVTIGRHGAPWTPDEARKEALQLKGEVARGGDPAEFRISEKRAPTLAELSTRYVNEHAVPKKKPNSARDDKRLLEKHINPRLGNRKVAEITRAEVTRLHLGLRSTPIQANRVLALLSKMMNLAEKWGLRLDGSNPCRHVDKFRERRRERFLSEDELAKLGEALTFAERVGLPTRDKPRGRRPLKPVPVSPYATAAIRVLLFTGCRLSEVVTLKWEHVDLERSCIRLPDSKTGAKVVLLGAAARAIFENLPVVDGNPFVFPGRTVEPSHFTGLPHVWYRVRKRAGLDDVRLHDLRHSFASVGAIGGTSLIVIGALLGHRQTATTARYAHLSDDPIRAAADRISQEIAAALERPDANAAVIAIRPHPAEERKGSRRIGTEGSAASDVDEVISIGA